MKVQALNTGFIMPTKGTNQAGAYDIYMPTDGYVDGDARMCGLGFAAEVPAGHIALLLPRSSAGAKYGIELNNTCGVIDADYRGEWRAVMRIKSGARYEWKAGDRLLQFLIIPAVTVNLTQVDELEPTERNDGGFGSSGK